MTSGTRSVQIPRPTVRNPVRSQQVVHRNQFASGFGNEWQVKAGVAVHRQNLSNRIKMQQNHLNNMNRVKMQHMASQMASQMQMQMAQNLAQMQQLPRTQKHAQKVARSSNGIGNRAPVVGCSQNTGQRTKAVVAPYITTQP